MVELILARTQFSPDHLVMLLEGRYHSISFEFDVCFAVEEYLDHLLVTTE